MFIISIDNNSYISFLPFLFDVITIGMVCYGMVWYGMAWYREYKAIDQ